MFRLPFSTSVWMSTDGFPPLGSIRFNQEQTTPLIKQKSGKNALWDYLASPQSSGSGIVSRRLVARVAFNWFVVNPLFHLLMGPLFSWRLALGPEQDIRWVGALTRHVGDGCYVLLYFVFRQTLLPCLLRLQTPAAPAPAPGRAPGLRPGGGGRLLLLPPRPPHRRPLQTRPQDPPRVDCSGETENIFDNWDRYRKYFWGAKNIFKVWKVFIRFSWADAESIFETLGCKTLFFIRPYFIHFQSIV